MKSMPAASAMRASFRQSGQLADQRSGTRVAERPDEQLAPNSPILSRFALNIAARSAIDAVRVSKAIPPLSVSCPGLARASRLGTHCAPLSGMAGTSPAMTECFFNSRPVRPDLLQHLVDERLIDHVVEIDRGLDQALGAIEREIVGE